MEDDETDAEAYTTAAKKGKLLLEAMKASPTSPVHYSQPSEWTSHFALAYHGWERYSLNEKRMGNSTWNAELTHAMRDHNISSSVPANIPISWRHERSTGPFNSHFRRTEATHDQVFNIAGGTIFALDIISPVAMAEGDPGMAFPTNRTLLHHWSDITFLQWQDLASDGRQLEGLKRVVHMKVTNSSTIGIIERVLKGKSRISNEFLERYEVKVTEADGDHFLALLGSVNGSGTGFMLAQHKKQLGWKVVKSVTVYKETQYILVLELDTIYPSADGGDGEESGSRSSVGRGDKSVGEGDVDDDGSSAGKGR